MDKYLIEDTVPTKEREEEITRHALINGVGLTGTQGRFFGNCQIWGDFFRVNIDHTRRLIGFQVHHLGFAIRTKPGIRVYVDYFWNVLVFRTWKNTAYW